MATAAGSDTATLGIVVRLGLRWASAAVRSAAESRDATRAPHLSGSICCPKAVRQQRRQRGLDWQQPARSARLWHGDSCSWTARTTAVAATGFALLEVEGEPASLAAGVQPPSFAGSAAEEVLQAPDGPLRVRLPVWSKPASTTTAEVDVADTTPEQRYLIIWSHGFSALLNFVAGRQWSSGRHGCNNHVERQRMNGEDKSVGAGTNLLLGRCSLSDAATPIGLAVRDQGRRLSVGYPVRQDGGAGPAGRRNDRREVADVNTNHAVEWLDQTSLELLSPLRTGVADRRHATV